MNPIYYIGIDPGVTTGLAVWDAHHQLLVDVLSFGIYDAQQYMRMLVNRYGSEQLFVRFEDARLRKFFGKSGTEKHQGAGSVKRDCSIWEEFLKKEGIRFEAVAPRHNRTKLQAHEFKLYTRWPKLTNEHSRDAAMLVFGLKYSKLFIQQ